MHTGKVTPISNIVCLKWRDVPIFSSTVVPILNLFAGTARYTAFETQDGAEFRFEFRALLYRTKSSVFFATFQKVLTHGSQGLDMNFQNVYEK